MSDLSSQEMARSVPALLVKIARLRPRVACFIGKGIWLHVERSLRLQADGSDANGLVVRATERCVTPKVEEIDNLMPWTSVNPGARPAKARPETTAFNLTTNSARSRTEDGDSSRRHLLAVQKTEESLDTGSLFLPPTTARRRVSPKAAPQPAFAYGLQPYKAVHDAAANVRGPHLCAHTIENFV